MNSTLPKDMLVGLFSRGPKPVQPGDVGLFLATYIDTRLLKSEATSQLRHLVSEEGVPEIKRVGFDNNLSVFTVATAAVAAKRIHGLVVARSILWAAVDTMLSTPDDRVNEYVRSKARRYEPLLAEQTSQGYELGLLVRQGCRELFDDDGQDFLFVGALTFWTQTHIRVFEQFLGDVAFERPS